MPSRRMFLRAAALAAPAVALPTAPTARALPVRGFAPPPTFDADGEIRICCLGDSRTQGAGDTNSTGTADWNGYRKPLLDNLRGPGRRHGAVMVGSQVSGSAGLRHEGWSGKTIGFLTDKVRAGALDNPAPTSSGPPHIVIVQAGANDVGQGRTPEQMLADMGTLLGEVLAVSPNLRIVLCEEILETGTVSETLTVGSLYQQAYNAGLPALIQAVDPTKISLVRSGDLTQDCLFDGVHPNHRGYAIWAAYIYAGGLPPWLGFRQRYLGNIDWPLERIPRERLSPS